MIKILKNTSPFDLQPIVEFTRTINSSLDLGFILNNVLLTIMGKLLFTKGGVVLSKSLSRFEVVKVKGLKELPVGEVREFTPLPDNWGVLEDLSSDRYPWVEDLRENGISHIFDMTVNEQLVGIVILGNRLSKEPLDDRESTFLRSLVNISATAIEKSKMLIELENANRMLGNKLQDLNTLFEMSKEFSSIVSREKLIKVLVFSLLGHLGVKRYLISLKSNGDIEVASSNIRMTSKNKEIFEELFKIRYPVSDRDIENNFSKEAKTFLIRSEIATIVPMTIQGDTRGIILLGSRVSGKGYSSLEFDFLISLGNLAMVSLENARLFEEMLEKQRMEEELKIAYNIQQGLLPGEIPKIEGFDIAARMIPSGQVGGDYYDIVKLDPERYLIVIADVSGKGIPAALLMSNLQATIRTIAPLDISIEEATGRVNYLICDNTAPELFITFFWGILDIKKNTLKYVNAGHNPPYLVKDGEIIRRLDKGGTILGVLQEYDSYQCEIISLENKDRLIFFTDGVTEAINPGNEEFEEKRLEEVILNSPSESAELLLEEITKSVTAFSQNLPQTDDITLLILRSEAG